LHCSKQIIAIGIEELAIEVSENVLTDTSSNADKAIREDAPAEFALLRSPVRTRAHTVSSRARRRDDNCNARNLLYKFYMKYVGGQQGGLM
jgi:hypothetical protein